MEGPVQAKAGVDVARELVGLGNDRLERRANESVAMRLAAGQGAGVAAQEWQVRSKFLTKRHLRIFSLETRIGAVFGDAAGLLQPWKDFECVRLAAPEILMHDWNKGPGIWFPPPGRACCTADTAAQRAGPLHIGGTCRPRLRLRLR